MPLRFIFAHFSPSGAHNKMTENENFRSFALAKLGSTSVKLKQVWFYSLFAQVFHVKPMLSFLFSEIFVSSCVSFGCLDFRRVLIFCILQHWNLLLRRKSRWLMRMYLSWRSSTGAASVLRYLSFRLSSRDTSFQQ